MSIHYIGYICNTTCTNILCMGEVTLLSHPNRKYYVYNCLFIASGNMIPNFNYTSNLPSHGLWIVLYGTALKREAICVKCLPDLLQLLKICLQSVKQDLVFPVRKYWWDEYIMTPVVLTKLLTVVTTQACIEPFLLSSMSWSVCEEVFITSGKPEPTFIEPVLVTTHVCIERLM